MNQPTYTQGPWRISTDYREPAVIAEIYTSGVAHLMIVPAKENALGDIVADAKVISAAPDLLEACISMIRWCDKNPPAGDALFFVSMAREAIAKALSPSYEQGRGQSATTLCTQSCEWVCDDDESMPDTWHGSCGARWSFIEGDPEENRMRFCPECGKPVSVRSNKENGATRWKK